VALELLEVEAGERIQVILIKLPLAVLVALVLLEEAGLLQLPLLMVLLLLAVLEGLDFTVLELQVRHPREVLGLHQVVVELEY